MEKTFFNPGEIVKLKHNIEHVPTMYVVEKVTKNFKKENTDTTLFIGIRCRWFDKDSQLQEGIFSSKDLIHI